MNREQTPLVLVFSTAFLPCIGGAELAIEHITKRTSGLRFLIITSRMSRKVPRTEKKSHVSIRRVGFGFVFDKWLLPFFGFFAGVRALRQEKKIILWGMMISQGTIAAYFIKKVWPSIPFVVTLQEGDSEEHIRRDRAGFIYFFWKRILARANEVTVISTYLKETAKRAGFVGEPVIIPNGVDEVFFEVDRNQRKKYREQLNIPENDLIILSVSRLVEKNGIDDLLRAFAIVFKSISSARLLLVGDGNKKNTLMSLARDLGVHSRVIFTGSLAYEKLPVYYGASDLFARPSRSEGLGSAFLEAMATGLPVVATPVGGIPDFLDDGVTGIFVPPRNPKRIAQSVIELLEDSERREEIGKRARAKAQKFSWSEISTHMEKVFGKYL